MKNVFNRAKKKFHLNPWVQKTKRALNPFASTDLPFILSHIDSRASFEDQIFWIERLLDWISSTGAWLPDTESAQKSSIQIVRIKFLLQLLGRNQVWKSHLCASLRKILSESSYLELFCQTGLHQEFGFWAEASDRLIRKVLPTPPNETNIAEFFGRVFAGDEAPEWVSEISGDFLLQISELFYFEADEPGEVFTRLGQDMLDAVVVLSATVGGIGLSKDLLRTKTGSPYRSSFYRLSLNVNAFVTKAQTETNMANLIDSINLCLAALHECRESIRLIFRALEDQGVSVAVVYRLDQLQFALNRIETLLHLVTLKNDRDSMNIIVHFVAELIREQNEQHGLMSLFRNNLRLLSKKIVERTGVTGEHYITNNRAEYFAMLKSGFGGGVVTVGTTLVKSWVGAMKLPVFWEFLGNGTTYAGSFVGIQLLGFTLATKQPSATAAHLAGKLENLNSQEKLNEFVEEFKKISRSQFAAAIGNIGMAAPASALLFLAIYFVNGQGVYSAEYAEHNLDSLNPFKSFTVFYAALTGVWLWLSSLMGGWIENWAVYRRIPDAIAQHRGLRARIGIERTKRFADWFSHSVAGLGSSVALGFLLAGVPLFSRIFGIFLDVRHVTLSTCSMTLSVCALWGHEVLTEKAIMAGIGIFFIGMLNFGVSFYLALMVAARARALSSAAVFFLFREVFKTFMRGPRDFFIPRR